MIAIPILESDTREEMARKFTAVAVGLVALNMYELQSRKFPRLYSSGVVYRQERAGDEFWLSVSSVVAEGRGDCEDLSAWRAAELRLGGLAARVLVIVQSRGYHAVVQLPDGSLEDPSEILKKMEREKSNGKL